MSGDGEGATCDACGGTMYGPDPAVHWNTPHGATIVADSCSQACADRIEAARDRAGRLTPAAIAALHN